MAANTLWRKQCSDIKTQISAYSASCNSLKNGFCKVHQFFLNELQEKLCSVHTAKKTASVKLSKMSHPQDATHLS